MASRPFVALRPDRLRVLRLIATTDGRGLWADG